MHNIKVFEGSGQRLFEEVDKWFEFLEEDGIEITIISTTQSENEEGVTLVIIFKYNDTKGE